MESSEKIEDRSADQSSCERCGQHDRDLKHDARSRKHLCTECIRFLELKRTGHHIG